MMAYIDPNNSTLAPYYSNFAISMSAAGHHKKAVEAYQSSMKLELNGTQPDYINIAYAYDGMATILHFEFGQDDSELGYWQQAFALMTTHLPLKHEDLLSLYENMADIYAAKNQDEKALELLYEYLRRNKTPPESSDRDRAFLYQCIADIHEKQNNFQKASEFRMKSEQLNHEFNRVDWNEIDFDALCKDVFKTQ